QDTQKNFFGVREDLEALSEAIHLALLKLDRLDSPIYLLGESYGGFRAALLPLELWRNYGINISATILLSPVIDFALMRGDELHPLPWALRLPSYAAVNLEKSGSLSAQSLKEAEDFALGDYLAGLAAPVGDAARREPIYEAAARLIGIPEPVVA